MVMQSTGKRSRVRHSTGTSWKLLGRMMRRRAMSYSRIEYLPGTTGRMTPLEYRYDKKERPVSTYEKVEHPGSPGQKEQSPVLERVSEPAVDVRKEGP